MFNKLSYNERDREKWSKVFSVKFMSSEESENDDVIEVHPYLGVVTGSQDYYIR